MDASAPSLKQVKTRTRRPDDWKLSAPVLNSELGPTEVCLVTSACVADLCAAVQSDQSPLWVFQADEWCIAAPALRSTARSHTLYPVVIRGDKAASKFCTQSVLRRLEFLGEWELILRQVFPADKAEAVIERQREHGLRRCAQRNRAEPKSPPDISRVRDPVHLEELLRTPVWELDQAVALGSRRTLRVYDISGAYVWLLPAATLAMLAKATEAAMEAQKVADSAAATVPLDACAAEGPVSSVAAMSAPDDLLLRSSSPFEDAEMGIATAALLPPPPPPLDFEFERSV